MPSEKKPLERKVVLNAGSPPTLAVLIGKAQLATYRVSLFGSGWQVPVGEGDNVVLDINDIFDLGGHVGNAQDLLGCALTVQVWMPMLGSAPAAPYRVELVLSQNGYPVEGGSIVDVGLLTKDESFFCVFWFVHSL